MDEDTKLRIKKLEREISGLHGDIASLVFALDVLFRFVSEETPEAFDRTLTPMLADWIETDTDLSGTVRVFMERVLKRFEAERRNAGRT